MPPPAPPAGLPPRRKPGERDENETPRKGRCLVREGDAYAEKKSAEPSASPERKQRQLPQSNETLRCRPKSGDYALLNGIRVTKSFFWATCSALIVIVLCTLSIPLYLYWGKLTSAAPKTEAEPEPAAKIADGEEPAIQTAPLRDSYEEIKTAALKQIEDAPNSVEEILEHNAQATGLGNARTVALEGAAITNNREFAINIFSKAPNLVRQVMSIDDTRITNIYNGQSGMLEVQNFTGKQQSSRAMAPNQSLKILMTDVIALPLWQYETAPTKLMDGGLENIDGETYRVVINRVSPLFEIKHYFDLDNMVERLRLAEYPDGDINCQIKVAFLNYQWNGQYYTPMRVEYEERGSIQVRAIIKVEKWSFNSGLLPSLFVVDANN